MKILMVCWYYPPWIGGVEVAASAWARAMDASGHSVRVLTSTSAEYRERVGPEVVPLKALAPDPSGYEPVAQCVFSVGEQLDIFRPDLIVGHQLTYPLAPAKSAALFALFAQRRIPVIDVAHNAHLRDPNASRMLLSSRLRGIVCVSAYVRDRIRNLGWSGPAPIVPNSVNTALFRPSPMRRSRTRRMLRLPFDAPVAFFPSRLLDIDGRLSSAKAAPDALAAFAYARRLSPSMLLLLAQPVGPVLRNLSEFGSLRGAVRSPTQPTEHIGMPALFDACDVVLVPSVEGFGIVFLEAMAMGKPVIALDAGAAREVLGNLGTLVPAHPAASRSRRLGAAVAKRSGLENCAKALRLRARLNFDETQHAARVEHALRL